MQLFDVKFHLVRMVKLTFSHHAREHRYIIGFSSAKLNGERAFGSTNGRFPNKQNNRILLVISILIWYNKHHVNHFFSHFNGLGLIVRYMFGMNIRIPQKYMLDAFRGKILQWYIKKIEMHLWWKLWRTTPRMTRRAGYCLSVFMGVQPLGMQRNLEAANKMCSLCKRCVTENANRVLFECTSLITCRTAEWSKVLSSMLYAMAQ